MRSRSQECRFFQSIQEIQHETVEYIVLFYAAYMTAFLDKAEGRFAHLLMGPLNAVYKEIILFSGDQKDGQPVLLDH